MHTLPHKNIGASNTDTTANLGKLALDTSTKESSSQVFDLTILEVVDGKVNLTKICQHFDKRIDHWLKAKSTQRFLEAYRVTPNGGTLEILPGKATFGDRRIAIKLAEWISVDFEIWCSQKIDELFQKRISQPKTPAELFLESAQNFYRLEQEQKEQAQKIQELDIKIETVASQPRLEVKGYKHTRDVLRAQKDELGNSINILVNRYFGEYMGISDFPTRFRTAYAKYYRDTGIPYCGANTATSDDKADFLGWLKLLVMKSSINAENFLETLNEAYL
jgi:hypothetical protein